jgi:hypothetical protein
LNREIAISKSIAVHFFGIFPVTNPLGSGTTLKKGVVIKVKEIRLRIHLEIWGSHSQQGDLLFGIG